MIAQEVFNLPRLPSTAPQGGVWGILLFVAIIVAVVAYLVRALPRTGDAEGEEGRPPKNDRPPQE